MRFRALSVLTNTPPRVSQSQPGGMQGITIIEPVLAKAGRVSSGIDQVAIRRLNSPEGKAHCRTSRTRRAPAACRHSGAFMQEALDKGAELFRWDERKAQQRAARRIEGARRRHRHEHVLRRLERLRRSADHQARRPALRAIRHRQLRHRIGDGCPPRRGRDLGIPWEKVEIAWGNTGKHLPWTCISGGSQTTHAMTRAAHAAGMDAKRKLQEIAARRSAAAPEQYQVAGERVFSGGRSMTLAQAAQKAIELGGKYRRPRGRRGLNAFTKQSAAALAGSGLMGVARDTYPGAGQPFSFVAGFAEVEVDVETGQYLLLDYLAVVDVGTVLHPRNLGGQILGRSMLGIGHAIGQKWVYDQHYGVALAKRFYRTSRRRCSTRRRRCSGPRSASPTRATPVGAKGIGEPPVAAGCCAVLNALSDALGDDLHPAGAGLTRHDPHVARGRPPGLRNADRQHLTSLSAGLRAPPYGATRHAPRPLQL